MITAPEGKERSEARTKILADGAHLSGMSFHDVHVDQMDTDELRAFAKWAAHHAQVEENRRIRYELRAGGTDFMGKDVTLDYGGVYPEAGRFVAYEDRLEPLACPFCRGDGNLALEIEVELSGDDDTTYRTQKIQRSEACPFCDMSGAFKIFGFEDDDLDLETYDAGSM